MKTSRQRNVGTGTVLSVAAFISAFSAASAAMADVELVFVSDFYDKTGSLVDGDPAYEVGQLIQGMSLSAVLATEVNNRTGTLTEYNNYINPVWSPFKSISHAVPGNHDYMTAGASGYKGYFNVTSTYSSFTITVGSTPWKIIGLNSNASKMSSLEWRMQAYFMARELDHESASGAQCTIAYFHHPRWSSGPHGSNNRTDNDNENVDFIWQTLASHNVELALSGHDHDYERFWPQDAYGNRVGYGVVQVVAGVGGAALVDAGAPIANSSVLIDKNSNPVAQPGVLIIHLYDHWPGYLAMYRSASGALLDYWWGECY